MRIDVLGSELGRNKNSNCPLLLYRGLGQLPEEATLQRRSEGFWNWWQWNFLLHPQRGRIQAQITGVELYNWLVGQGEAKQEKNGKFR